MLTAPDIIKRYIAFFQKRKHQQIANAPLVPQNDPTTLFTSSGMQPLVPYLLGEPHPQGTRLVNVQNSFRAVDIEEVGDNRHTTFFRMLGNWSLGDYFKKDQIPWLFTFLTDQKEGLGLSPKRLHFTVFKGVESIPQDNEAYQIWEDILQKAGVTDYKNRIHWYGAKKNWWSRSGTPDKMPSGEPGGPDTEVFYDFGDVTIHEKSAWKDEECHVNCDCGRYIEIANSVFMQYQKQDDGSFKDLPKQNVDFGGGLERFLMASENQPDVFRTSLFTPIITAIEQATEKKYEASKKEMRIIADHFVASSFIILADIAPSNKDQGYILRRLIRRGLDNFYMLKGRDLVPVLEEIAKQYGQTDTPVQDEFEKIKLTILEEEQMYKKTREAARKTIEKKYQGNRQGDELMGVQEISADDAFLLYTTHGLSPTQITSLGYTFDEQQFAQKMKEHKDLSRTASAGKFKGGLADHSEQTIMGHTATHLLHQALRDVLGNSVHQTGSNITSERVRFDFSYDQKLTDEETKKVEAIVNQKIKENLPVHFELIPTEQAHKMGAIGLFMDTYGEKSKIYFIGGGPSTRTSAEGGARSGRPYSVEFCGGPHVDFTSVLGRVTIIKQENIGHGQRRIYAKVGE